MKKEISLFSSTMNKDVKFSHTESSYSNSIVARALLIAQAYYTYHTAWIILHARWQVLGQLQYAANVAGGDYS